MVGVYPTYVLQAGAFLAGAFFFSQKSAHFNEKCLFVCFYDKTSLFIIKRPDTGGFARLRALQR